MRWHTVNHLSEQPTSPFAKERTAWPWVARSRTSEKGGRHEPTIRLSCPGRARRGATSANGTGRAHRLTSRSTPEIHYGSKDGRSLTCFEVPLREDCSAAKETRPSGAASRSACWSREHRRDLDGATFLS